MRPLFILVSGAVTLCLLVNIILYVLPVEEGNGYSIYSEELPLELGTPHRTFNYSRNWDFSVFNKVAMNSAGLHDYEYPDIETPKILFVGDSYIEGYMIPRDDLVSSQVARSYPQDKYHVINMGVAGAGLATHLSIFKNMISKHDIERVFILLNEDDFGDSSENINGNFQFLRSENQLELVLPKVKTKKENKLNNIPILRYVYSNLKMWPKALMQKLYSQEIASCSYYHLLRKEEPSEVSGQNKTHDMEAVYFIKQLVKLIPVELRSKVVLMHSGEIQDRYYKTGYKQSSSMSLIIDKAKGFGFGTLDINEIFINDWARNRRPHNSVYDRHWNSWGHSVVAEAIIERF